MRRSFFAAALAALLAGCGTDGPSVVTKVEYVYPKVDPSFFQTEVPAPYPPPPPGRQRNTDVQLFGVCEARGGQIDILNARLLGVRQTIMPPVEEPPCPEDGRTDCR